MTEASDGGADLHHRGGGGGGGLRGLDRGVRDQGRKREGGIRPSTSVVERVVELGGLPGNLQMVEFFSSGSRRGSRPTAAGTLPAGLPPPPDHLPKPDYCPPPVWRSAVRCRSRRSNN